MTKTPIIDEIEGSDSELSAALLGAGLPADDLELPGRKFFRFRDGPRLIGFVGWEGAGTHCALLRSLVVLPAMRGQGWGNVMTLCAMARLSKLGMTEAWMLTTTAETLAINLGFERADRDSASEGIRQSRQFTDLCPASAVLLRKRLA
ncbi:MAG TPA: GNAT family N-acetyltransferase [Magnetospirillaceae bacterium]|jgi:N-acetylglutamate synthase-like GNAT family acetyltransferase